jgi:hypothetical protein
VAEEEGESVEKEDESVVEEDVALAKSVVVLLTPELDPITLLTMLP